MPTGTKEVLLIVIGFVLGFVPSWLDRKRRLKAHLQAIRAEMQLARARGNMLLNDNIMAPLYRLPVSAYETSFPVLLAEGVLSEEGALSLGDYFCQVQDINRGLDNATAMAHANDDAGVRREYDRLLVKARHLMENGPQGQALYAAGLAVVEQQISRSWWRY
ncbi:MAG: hypothetical protein WAW75_11755 [Gallionella sp.]